MSQIIQLPYIPPKTHRPARREKIRVVWGQVDAKTHRPEPTVYESPLCKCWCFSPEKWPAGAKWLAFPACVSGKIIVLGPAWLQGIYDEAEARLKGVWI